MFMGRRVSGKSLLSRRCSVRASIIFIISCFDNRELSSFIICTMQSLHIFRACMSPPDSQAISQHRFCGFFLAGQSSEFSHCIISQQNHSLRDPMSNLLFEYYAEHYWRGFSIHSSLAISPWISICYHILYLSSAALYLQ